MASENNANGGDGANGANGSGGQSLPERVTLWLSVAVVLALIGYIAWHGWATQNETPMLTPVVHADRARPRAGRWAVPVEIRNLSSSPIEDVQVRVEVTDASGKRSDVDLSFAYLAEHARETAWIVTDVPPERARPRATLESFKSHNGARGY